MAGPNRKAGTVHVKFGAKGRATPIDERIYRAGRKPGMRLYEDSSVGPKNVLRPGQQLSSRPKKRTPPRPKLPPKITQKARSVSTTKRY